MMFSKKAYDLHIQMNISLCECGIFIQNFPRDEVFFFITGVLRSSSMMARAAADLNTGLNIAWVDNHHYHRSQHRHHRHHHHQAFMNLAGGLTV